MMPPSVLSKNEANLSRSNWNEMKVLSPANNKQSRPQGINL